MGTCYALVESGMVQTSRGGSGPGLMAGRGVDRLERSLRPTVSLSSFQDLGDLVVTDRFWMAVGTTLRRAAVGYAVAVGIGTTLGLAVSQNSIFRRRSVH